MLGRAGGCGCERGVDVQRQALGAYELGEDELGGSVGAVGDCCCWFPVREGEEIAGLHLGCGALGTGETVCDLDQHGGKPGRGDALRVGITALEVVDLPQQPADCANRGAEESGGGEVSTYWR